MANELNITTNLSFQKGGAALSKGASLQLDVTGTYYESKVLSVTTGNDLIDLGDMTTVGYVHLKNLDATNFVLAGDTSGQYPIKMLAGESCLFRVNGTTLYLSADTAACDVEISCVED